MLAHFLRFEWQFYKGRIGFYLLLLGFLAFGIFTGWVARFPIPDVARNSPYTIAFVMGLLSLACVFVVAILAGQALFREVDAGFESIFFALPMRKEVFLVGRGFMVFGLSCTCFALLTLGLMLGLSLTHPVSTITGPFHFWHYLHPFLVWVVPNIGLCTAVICAVGWYSRSKKLLYTTALGIYIAYMAISLFSNSPLMAGASPVSQEAMAIAARLDPFGLSAFLEQTQSWLPQQRNQDVANLSGHLLFNRLLYLCLSLIVIAITVRSYEIRPSRQSGSKAKLPKAKRITPSKYVEVSTQLDSWRYAWQSLWSYLRIDALGIGKGIPSIVIGILTTFLLAMEMYAAIDGGIRIPQRFATTTLMANAILESLPIVMLITLVFYSGEVFGRSKASGFRVMEEATPASRLTFVSSKLVSLALIPAALISLSILIGVTFQLIFHSPTIEWQIYAQLMVYIGVPALLVVGLLVAVQSLCENAYLGMAICTPFLLLTHTSLGQLAGLRHVLLRFAPHLPIPYSEMNGLGPYPIAFAVQQAYALGFVIILLMLGVLWKDRKQLGKHRRRSWATMAIGVLLMGTSAWVMLSHQAKPGKVAVLDARATYEQQFRSLASTPQPEIVSVQTVIHLDPALNRYQVQGIYTLENQDSIPMTMISVYADPAMEWDSICFDGGTLAAQASDLGQRSYQLHPSLKPGECLQMRFGFKYQWSAFQGHEAFNAIVENGTFLRISNYYPRLGYQADLEIEDSLVRVERGLGAARPLLKLEEKPASPHRYGFIDLDAVISTSGDQTPVGVGECIGTWRSAERNYAHFRTEKPIPFRFAVSSARYAVQTSRQAGIDISVYYHPAHAANVPYLIDCIQKTLAYCTAHFGPYPFRSIRFAEISSFTEGFGATAYPATIYFNESAGFNVNMEADLQKDVLNQLAGHELAHAWWGGTQIAPENREGSQVLTETLAMYTELMLLRAAHGVDGAREMRDIYQDLYDADKGFSPPGSLLRVKPADANLCYNKGLLVMYDLERLLSERCINEALASLLREHAYPKSPPTSLDLLMEFHGVSEAALHPKIDALFLY